MDTYCEYIIQHKDNIKKAFNKYGNTLCKQLKIDYFKLKKIIEAHDISKLDEEEYEAYRQYYYPKNNETPNKKLFYIGWLHHQNHNKHHPEYWTLRDNKKIIALDMDNYSIAEMLLDWYAVGMDKESNTYDWYMNNKDTLVFSKKTRAKVNDLINIFR